MILWVQIRPAIRYCQSSSCGTLPLTSHTMAIMHSEMALGHDLIFLKTGLENQLSPAKSAQSSHPISLQLNCHVMLPYHWYHFRFNSIFQIEMAPQSGMPLKFRNIHRFLYWFSIKKCLNVILLESFLKLITLKLWMYICIFCLQFCLWLACGSPCTKFQLEAPFTVS